MRSVPLHIDNQLVTNLALSKTLSSHLRFDDKAFTFQEKVHTPRLAAQAGRHLLCSHIVEMESQEGVHQVLDVVFVNNSHGLAVVVPIKQLVGKLVKSLAQCCNQQFCVEAIPANLPMLLDFGFQGRCDDFSQGLVQHSSPCNINILQDVQHGHSTLTISSQN